MTVQRPLILTSGQIQELAGGDTIVGASAPMPYYLADGDTYTVADNVDALSSKIKLLDGFLTVDGFLTDVL